MKTFELEKMGVQEMDAIEVKITDGGSFILGAILFLAGVGIGFIVGREGSKAN